MTKPAKKAAAKAAAPTKKVVTSRSAPERAKTKKVITPQVVLDKLDPEDQPRKPAPTGKKFTLREGDTVWFKDKNDSLKRGTLVKWAYGRRLWCAVKDENGVLHHLESRDRIVRKVENN